MSAHVAVTAIGDDRPGIVAAVTGVLVDHSANIEDSSMTILRGHFAMVLVVAVPPGTDPAALERSIVDVTGELGLIVTVRAIDDQVATQVEGAAWTLSVHGADRPGIVHRVTALLAGEGVNIVDLTTRVVGDPDAPAYVMLLELTIPGGVDAERLHAELAVIGRDLGVECHLHESEADVL
jgi:glycine cleavage system transcriptional repressor